MLITEHLDFIPLLKKLSRKYNHIFIDDNNIKMIIFEQKDFEPKILNFIHSNSIDYKIKLVENYGYINFL